MGDIIKHGELIGWKYVYPDIDSEIDYIIKLRIPADAVVRVDDAHEMAYYTDRCDVLEIVNNSGISVGECKNWFAKHFVSKNPVNGYYVGQSIKIDQSVNVDEGIYFFLDKSLCEVYKIDQRSSLSRTTYKLLDSFTGAVTGLARRLESSTEKYKRRQEILEKARAKAGHRTGE